jgi:hypothetical protein
MINSGLQISWNLNGPEPVAGNTIVDAVRVATATSDSGFESGGAGKLLFISNKGNLNGLFSSTGFQGGFYANTYSQGADSSMERLLKLGAIEEFGMPCGLFLIFGYDEADESYIEKYKDGVITAEELKRFQVNWSQGWSIGSRIKLSAAKRYLGTAGYVVSDNFGNAQLPVNENLESGGILKLALVLRYPSGYEAQRFLINLNFYFEEEL